MKASITLIHVSPIHTDSFAITRKRAAYLLRASRSRRRFNVSRLFNRYTLNDCSHLIVKA